MISRRTILAWLGLAPFAIAATKLDAVAQTVAPRTRQRWKTVLNPDGSSDFVKGDKRWLDAWVDDRKERLTPDKIGPEKTYNFDLDKRDLDELKTVEANHVAEVKAMEDRSNPWRELNEFEEKYERKVPIEIKIYDKGEYMPWDPCVASKNGIKTQEYPPRTLPFVAVE